MMHSLFFRSFNGRFFERISLVSICLLTGLFFSAGFASAQAPGVSADEILIGQSCALKGPAQALGKGMRDGALAYFRHVNGAGGVHGKKLRMVTYDDGYEPKACKANTIELIDKDKVFLLFGYVGTPTSKAAAPIAAKRSVPYFAPFTGAEFLRDPLIRQVFNIRASYFQETEAMVQRLISDKNIKRISVFYQNDSYGKAGLAGVNKALDKRDMKIVNEAHYPRNTLDVEEGVKAILMTRPEAIIMIGAYEPCAKFIRLMREAGSDALFLNVSFVGADAMGQILVNEGLGVVITQVVPYPYNRRVPIVEEYNSLSAEAFPGKDSTFPGMEGFIAAKALVAILQKTPSPITREGFILAAESMTKVDLGGFIFSFSPTNHQGSDLVYFSQVGPGGFISPIFEFSHLYEYIR